jgi:hypothetical protein
MKKPKEERGGKTRDERRSGKRQKRNEGNLYYAVEIMSDALWTVLLFADLEGLYKFEPLQTPDWVWYV